MYPLLLLMLMASQCRAECPIWTHNSTNDTCKCGRLLGGLVHCDPETLQVSVQLCYCMTYNEHIKELVLGFCMYTCEKRDKLKCLQTSEIKTNDTRLLNQEICGPYHRKGQLCGNCTEGHGLPVYSYSLECVPCSESEFKQNLLKYIAVAFLPLTVFYFFVILFKISISSGNMVGYILTCQIFTLPLLTRFLLNISSNYAFTSGYIKFLTSCFSIWNLDFFRSLYTPFCIHPKLNSLHVLALDYLIGVYPLLLILLTYIAVTLHDRYPIVVRAWKPVYRIFMCMRREWNIRGSLIQAFATFLILSYVKILNVSFDLLFPANLQTAKGRPLDNTYLFHNAEIAYFGKQHSPFAILAIFMLITFNILPVMLLSLYPNHHFRKCLSYLRLQNHLIQPCMDVFQGCYHYHPRDYRYFAGFNMSVRILYHLTLFLVKDRTFFFFWGFYYIVLAMLTVFPRPYTKELHNKINMLLFVLNAFVYFAIGLYMHIPFNRSQTVFNIGSISLVVLITLGESLYGAIAVIKKILPKKTFQALKAIFQHTKLRLVTFPPQFERDDESLPLLR